MAASAGARPRLGQGHPNSAARRPDPPVTELALFSPKGKGADAPHRCLERGQAAKPGPAAGLSHMPKVLTRNPSP